MVSLVAILVLAFLSFTASAFVIFRIVIPILPPHPLSKRVSPAEFGLPTFRSLSPADKCHIWLAALDLVAVSFFIWEFVNEATLSSSPLDIATNPASAIRLWIAVTIRQTCLLIIASITLLHIRMARSVSFGAKHWMLWMPTLVLVFTSTTIAGILSGTGVGTLFYGLMFYSVTIAVLSSLALGCLIRTLFIIKKNLSVVNSSNEWPPVRQVEEKPRPSFATEDIDAIRDGASWITSNASSRPNSISAWSFSTHHTVATSHRGRPQNGMHPSVPAKSSFWFGSTDPNEIHVPPVPPLPSPYGPTSPTSTGLADADPFRRDLPPLPNHPRTRFGSQSSWLTSSNGSHTTLTSWSYPTAHYEDTTPNVSTPDLHTALATAVTRPNTPALADAQVLGGYGYAPRSFEAEKGLAALEAPPGTVINISLYNALGWSIMIWMPLGFAFPYFFFVSQQVLPSMVVQTFFVLSVTLSSPLLAFNTLLGSPLPIPTGLFDIRGSADSNQAYVPGSLPPHKWSHEYKRSTSASVTVVEGRRSGDVWLSKGDAVDGKGKFGRAVTLLAAKPKLSVLPPEAYDEPETPPLPFQNDDSQSVHVHGTPHSELSAQFGRLRADSQTGSHNSGGDESLAFATKIMIAQRHYSALAHTVVVPGGATTTIDHDSAGLNALTTATGVTKSKRTSHSSHLRTRSVSSVNGPATPKSHDGFSISPPPSFPLPPTPPNVRAARLAMLAHKKSFSSGFAFGAVDDINEIDALTAGVLPVLVPGLTVGDDMKIKEGGYSPPGTYSKSKGMKAVKKLVEFGADFSSPEVHSTPARYRTRNRKESGHKRNHFSLPSLGLGKEGTHSLANWSTEIRYALENKVGQYMAVPSNVDLRRNTVLGVESGSNALVRLRSVREEDRNAHPPSGLKRNVSTRSLGLRADVPHNVDTARSSLASLNNMPPSAASTATLFEDFEVGLDSGPQAESTPHNSVSQKSTRRPAPPMPEHRHSTIRYIKSEDTQNVHVRYPMESEAPIEPTTSKTSVAQWSSRTVRPFMSKAGKLQRNSSGSASPKDGLRPLTLLQDRANIIANASPTSDVRPLSLAKKQKSRVGHQDENANVPTTSRNKNKNIKLLTLVRSETSKMRGVLRKTEVLPDVVVRPPSTSEHAEFTYSFRD